MKGLILDEYVYFWYFRYVFLIILIPKKYCLLKSDFFFHHCPYSIELVLSPQIASFLKPKTTAQCFFEPVRVSVGGRLLPLSNERVCLPERVKHIPAQLLWIGTLPILILLLSQNALTWGYAVARLARLIDLAVKDQFEVEMKRPCIQTWKIDWTPGFSCKA